MGSRYWNQTLFLSDYVQSSLVVHSGSSTVDYGDKLNQTLRIWQEYRDQFIVHQAADLFSGGRSAG